MLLLNIAKLNENRERLEWRETFEKSFKLIYINNKEVKNVMNLSNMENRQRQ